MSEHTTFGALPIGARFIAGHVQSAPLDRFPQHTKTTEDACEEPAYTPIAKYQQVTWVKDDHKGEQADA